MRALSDVTPTAEQLALFSRIQPGIEVIRGAAGSGKTTTALLKLRAAVGKYLNRRRRVAGAGPVNVLVLTFNRTLRGYVAELAARQFEAGEAINLEIDTFSRWAKQLLGNPNMIESEAADAFIGNAAKGLGLPQDFAIEEARYVMERFLPETLPNYLTARRDGRGTVPRMERPMREALLNQVIYPYMRQKESWRAHDWNDLAIALARESRAAYDIVIVDETQDFSANEVRAVLNQLSKEHTVTFVLDSTQRIYPRSFVWSEVGVTLRPENSFKLTANYRNTRQIAQFAASILAGMNVDDDGSLPNFESATRIGEIPVVLTGSYSAQVAYAIQKIQRTVDLKNESVAFLHAKGGGWFKSLRGCLGDAGMQYVELARKLDWPPGSENIGLSTLHSAKGLEFDHIFILGLNAEVIPTSDAAESGAERLNAVRRLVAMGVGRAKKTVTIGYKPSDAPEIAAFFEHGMCQKISV